MATNEDFKEALDKTLLFAPQLYDGLVFALRHRQRFERKEPEPVPGANARMLLSAAINVLAVIVGQEALEEAYGDDPPADAPRADQLMAAWWRLTLSDVFRVTVGDYASPSSPFSIRDEIHAIAKGDRPTLLGQLPGTKGRPVNSHRLAHHQLAAHEWETFLREKGWSVSDAQNAVATAYGQTWATISKWKAPIVRELGQPTYDNAMRLARLGLAYYRSTSSVSDDETMLSLDGEAHRREQRRSLVSLEK